MSVDIFKHVSTYRHEYIYIHFHNINKCYGPHIYVYIHI